MIRNKQQKGSITSFDVADLAGVSASTVSLVVTGKAKGRVSEEKQKKVLEACEILGYQINSAARSLRLGSSETIGLFVPSVTNPFFSKVLQGAQRQANLVGYNVLLMDMMEKPDWESWMVYAINGQIIDGCILYLPELIPSKIIEKFKSKAILVEVETPNYACLVIDIENGTKAALKHLIDLGHTKIAFLDADYEAVTFKLRRKAFIDTLTENNLLVYQKYINQTKYGLENTINAAYKILNQVDPPTAIFCADDYFVPGVYKAAHRLNISIPNDLSVVGYDDSELARILEPELTSVSIPAEKVGELSVLMLLDSIKEFHPVKQIIPTNLIIRDSSTFPPKRI